jgi:hypothetical protein
MEGTGRLQCAHGTVQKDSDLPSTNESQSHGLCFFKNDKNHRIALRFGLC